MTLTYQFENKLYMNITNKCTCECVFCLRDFSEGVGDGESLRLSRDAAADEVIADLKKRDLSAYAEIVFCGFGEPTENLDTLLEVARFLKSATKTPIRLDTNGLASLSNKKPVPPLLKGLIDIISISLNAPDAKRYLEITNNIFGEAAFQVLLDFAAECKKYIPDVRFSIVDVLSADETEACKRIAADMAIPLRIREIIK